MWNIKEVLICCMHHEKQSNSSSGILGLWDSHKWHQQPIHKLEYNLFFFCRTWRLTTISISFFNWCEDIDSSCTNWYTCSVVFGMPKWAAPAEIVGPVDFICSKAALRSSAVHFGHWHFLTYRRGIPFCCEFQKVNNALCACTYGP